MAEPISDMANMRHDLTYQEKPRSVLTAAASTIVFVPAGNMSAKSLILQIRTCLLIQTYVTYFVWQPPVKSTLAVLYCTYIHVLVPGTGTVTYCTVPVQGESSDCTVL